MSNPPMSGKERRWLDILGRWRQSQLSICAFCERHGLSEATFYYWRRVLRERGLLDQDSLPREPALTTPAFVKLAVDLGPVGPQAIELALPQGRVLRIRPGFDPELLRQLLRLLEEPSC